MAITRRQKEVIDFLSSFTQKNGYSPSYEEIAHGLGLTSLATVHKHVTNLQNKGLLQRAHNRSRSIDVLPPRSSKKGFDRLPLMGSIAAGKPIEAIETAESISLADIIGNREVFALEVRGDSMRDEHIVSGDFVLVERTRTAREGEIIVALVDGYDATLKRFYREGDNIRLPQFIHRPAHVAQTDHTDGTLIVRHRISGVARQHLPVFAHALPQVADRPVVIAANIESLALRHRVERAESFLRVFLRIFQLADVPRHGR